MGRHASPAAPAPLDPPDAEGSALTRLASRHLPRVTLAVAAAATTTLAVAWTGNAWSTAALAGGVVAVVVLAAAWLASTVPAPPAPPAPLQPPEPATDATDRSTDPVQ